MAKLNHIAIATDDVKELSKRYAELFHVEPETPISVPDQGVISGYIPLEGCGIELIQPTDPEGGIRHFMDRHGPGLHHIALSVDDLDAAEAEYRAAGYRLIVGTANGHKSIFVHPKSTGGVLIELCPVEEQ